jgi:hypothetical protein
VTPPQQRQPEHSDGDCHRTQYFRLFHSGPSQTDRLVRFREAHRCIADFPVTSNQGGSAPEQKLIDVRLANMLRTELIGKLNHCTPKGFRQGNGFFVPFLCVDIHFGAEFY